MADLMREQALEALELLLPVAKHYGGLTDAHVEAIENAERTIRNLRNVASAALAMTPAQGVDVADIQSRLAQLERERDNALAFLDSAVSTSPEPLVELGGWLASLLDEDHWVTAERYLNAAAKACAGLATPATAQGDDYRAGIEAAARWHDERIAILDEQIAENNAYATRTGAAVWEANKYCGDLKSAHRLAAHSIRAIASSGAINWRSDPDAIVEDDEPQIGRDYA